VLAALDATVQIDVRWRGGAVDGLVDRRHASIVESVIRILRAQGWDARPEVSFARYGERGSIDVLAWNAASGAVLLIEVKSEIHDIEETLRRFHGKVRLAPDITFAELGWRPTTIGAALVVPESSAARRRLESYAATFGSMFPDRGRDLRPWLRAPVRPLSAVWFLSPVAIGADPHSRLRIRVRPDPLPDDPEANPGSADLLDSDPVRVTQAAAWARRGESAADPSHRNLIGIRRPTGGDVRANNRPRMPATAGTRTTLQSDDRRALARAGFVLDDDAAANRR
jgi:hypothetical protein